MSSTQTKIVCLFFVGIIVFAVVLEIRNQSFTEQDYIPVGKIRLASNVPDEWSSIHPWIRKLIDSDVADVKVAIEKRMGIDSEDYQAIIRDFVPYEISFAGKTGYVHCLKKSCRGVYSYDVTDHLFICQPYSDDLIAKNVTYFDEAVRPEVSEFLKKFAGSGESMPGMSGQFTVCEDVLSDIAGVNDKYSEWNDAPVLYHSRSGDLILINRQGRTVWIPGDQDEIYPLFDSIPELVQHYASFRRTDKVFHSYDSLDFIGKSIWK